MKLYQSLTRKTRQVVVAAALGLEEHAGLRSEWKTGIFNDKFAPPSRKTSQSDPSSVLKSRFYVCLVTRLN